MKKGFLKIISLLIGTALAINTFSALISASAAETKYIDVVLPELAEGESGMSYSFCVSVVDKDNDKTPVEGVSMRLAEYDSYDSNGSVKRGEYIRTIAEWNTSDANPMVINCSNLREDHYYVAECDALPENYRSYPDRTGKVDRGLYGRNLIGISYNHYEISLENKKPVEVWDTFPVTVNAEFGFKFIDYFDRVELGENKSEMIPELKVEITDVYRDEYGGYCKGDSIGIWNTSDGEILFNKEVTFKSAKDYVYFGIKAENMPEYYLNSFKSAVSDCSTVDDYYVYKFTGEEVRTERSYHSFVLYNDNASIYTTAMQSTTTVTTMSDVPETTDTTAKITTSTSDTTVSTTITTTTATTTDSNTEPENFDLNNDGKIDISDAAYLLKKYAERAAGNVNEEDYTKFDVNGDGVVDVADAALVLETYSKSAASVN
ncbi:MAG: dockerin type I repeat-containing protein [Oscillospiraceae bacterium]|nr:dockerin type I repeat-containing protein [Oscillospiraceae bacterium]